MNKVKLIYNQTLMISTGILFAMGIRTVVLYFLNGEYMVNWQWYIPISMIIAGFLCALASLILYREDDNKKVNEYVTKGIHFVLVYGIVSLCGYIFRWYTNLREYLFIVMLYVIIYVCVWVYSIWMFKNDEKIINKAIDEIRDEE